MRGKVVRFLSLQGVSYTLSFPLGGSEVETARDGQAQDMTLYRPQQAGTQKPTLPKLA